MQAAVPVLAATSQKVPVILNGSAGPGHSAAEAERLQRAFGEAGIDAEVLPARSGEEIGELARRAIKLRPPIMVAGGGDGTLNTVANVVRGTQTALGILPLGTLNHFAKDLKIPLEQLRYWSAPLQEAYAGPAEALKRWQETQG